MDTRIGVNIDPEFLPKLDEICAQYTDKGISRGFFLEAMVAALDPEARDRAIKTHLERAAAARQAKQEQKKQLQKALKNLSPEQIQAILAGQQA